MTRVRRRAIFAGQADGEQVFGIPLEKIEAKDIIDAIFKIKLKIIAVQNILTESVHWKTLGVVEKLSTAHRWENSDPLTAF